MMREQEDKVLSLQNQIKIAEEAAKEQMQLLENTKVNQKVFRKWVQSDVSILMQMLKRNLHSLRESNLAEEDVEAELESSPTGKT